MTEIQDNDEGPKSAVSWKSKLLLLFATTLLCMAAAEIYFRLTSPHIIRKDTSGSSGAYVASGDYGYFMDTLKGRRHIPNTHVIRVEENGEKIPVDINAHGFRDDVIKDKLPNETRILVLGDSTTFGSYVQADITYVEHAEEYLHAQSQDGLIRFINGGVEGIGMKDEIDILEDQGLAISPDIVVIAWYLNDGNPPDRLAAGLADPGFVRRHSVLAQTIYRAYKYQQWRQGRMEEANMYGWLNVTPPGDWRTNRNSFMQYAAVAEKDWGSAWKPSTWVVIEEQMQRLQKIAQEHNFRVVILAFPVVFQVYAEYIEDEPQQRLRVLADKYHFRFFDLLPELRYGARAKNDLFFDHCHLLHNGHDIAGKALATFLYEDIISKSSGSYARK